MEMPIDMQHQQMGYDRAATMFSPDGHLLQVEYAEKTVRLGTSSIAMVCSDGIFILSDKRISDSLIVKESLSRIYEIDSHIISSVAGLVADARVLINKSQILAQKHKLTYDSPIEPELIIREISNLKQQFTQYGGARPFGASLMVIGIQEGVGRLYTSDITGNYFEYYANAIGEKDEEIKEKLRKSYKKELDLKKGIKLAVEIMKETHGDKFDFGKLELAYIDYKTKKIKRKEGKKILE